ncbi:hypothetical protein, partial [Lactobacillus helveticus]|uniref:hypothetical protein n=1 Tax=Lactobacillus helveticus TaxID=1587 RepID=UPI001C275399
GPGPELGPAPVCPGFGGSLVLVSGFPGSVLTPPAVDAEAAALASGGVEAPAFGGSAFGGSVLAVPGLAESDLTGSDLAAA